MVALNLMIEKLNMLISAEKYMAPSMMILSATASTNHGIQRMISNQIYLFGVIE